MGQPRKALCLLAVIWGLFAIAVPTALGAGGTASEVCGNAEIRERQSSTELPECRAYEMATPIDKNGNEVTGFLTVQGAPDGSGVAFGSTGAFPGAEAAPAISSYLSTRGGTDWATRALTPPQLNPGEVLGAGARDFSRNLERTLVVSKLPLTPGAIPGNGNVFLEDMRTGQLQFVTTTADPTLYSDATNTGGNGLVGGADDSFEHIVITTTAKLTPNAPEGVYSLYEIDNGKLSLASILPNGEPSATGAEIGGGIGNQAESRPVSADGHRFFFQAERRLYERIDDERTIELSASEVPGNEEIPSATFGGASEDGSVAFFTANARLTPDAQPVPGEQFPPYRLYRYADGHLEQLAVGIPNFAGRLDVLSVTPDGDTAYFVIESQNGETTEARQPRIYRWHLGEGVTEVVALEDLGEFDREPARWTASPNGRYAAFQALSLLTPDAKPGDCSLENSAAHRLEGRCYEIYVLDSQTGRLSCVSCSPSGKAPTGSSSMGGLFNGASNGELAAPRNFSHYQPRGIDNEGTVYFDTPNRLTTNDGDARRDVYQWQNGTVSLLTPGTATDTAYADASSDGSTVFVLTADRLVSQDVDNSRDLYAVRRDGGLISQNPLAPPGACEGEACRAVATPPPAAKSPGSVGLNAPGPRLWAPQKAVIHGGRGTLRLTVPGAGTVSVRGSGMEPTKQRFRDAGSGGVSVSLAAKTQKRLNRKGRVQVRAKVTYQPTQGETLTRQVVLTFVSGKGR